MQATSWRLSASGDPPRGGAGGLDPDGLFPADREELPYTVEVWDEGEQALELVLAVTASASIGYAAFYAATREHPRRLIVLRHKNRVVSRWNGPAH